MAKPARSVPVVKMAQLRPARSGRVINMQARRRRAQDKDDERASRQGACGNPFCSFGTLSCEPPDLLICGFLSADYADLLAEKS